MLDFEQAAHILWVFPKKLAVLLIFFANLLDINIGKSCCQTLFSLQQNIHVIVVIKIPHQRCVCEHADQCFIQGMLPILFFSDRA
jgi:hypothetical protein